ncbi:MAG: T9SS type A sorting domain-containing protein [Flavobacteriales bacterium]|nr:T9SS type A sorting domain-containing protein [Flavobacteriales bacterium]
MRLKRKQRMVLVVALLATTSLAAQQPFDLDPSFRTVIQENYVNSIAVLGDGGIFLSGRIKFPGDQNFRGSAKLLSNGQQDLTFPTFPQTTGGGPIRRWNDQYYVMTAATVRRLTAAGLVDPSFVSMNSSPYFGSNQGGDYHVFPDGRVLLSGVHAVNYPPGGFSGSHCLVWFTNTGQLDTTRIHRKCNGAVYDIEPLPDGKFLLSGVLSTYEGTPVGRIFRVHADGALDTTFQTTIHWGQAVGYHQQADGKVIAAGRFLFQGDPDTLHLVRLMPDGQRDESFNNHLRSWTTQGGSERPWGGLYPITPDRFIVYGAFEAIDEQPRGAIALIDTAGNLLDDWFGEGGCGSWNDQGLIKRSVSGIVPDGDGNYYIWGSYHGYNDGTTNDTQQRMVSRLYGLNVGVPEQEQLRLEVFPNPASTQLTVQLEHQLPGAVLLLRDALGREVLQQRVAGHYNTLAVQGLAPGVYLLELWGDGRRMAKQRVVVE